MQDPAKRSIDKKLTEVMQIVAHVQKDARNAHHKYKYASAEAVLKKINPSMVARNLSISTQMELVHFAERDNKMDAVVRVALNIHDGDSGESRLFTGLGQGRDKGDKAVMKALTAAHKYAYALGFCISWGDDPEADAKTDAAAPAPRRAKAKPAAKAASKTLDPAVAEGMFFLLIDEAQTLEALKEVQGRMVREDLVTETLKKAWRAKATKLQEGDTE